MKVLLILSLLAFSQVSSARNLFDNRDALTAEEILSAKAGTFWASTLEDVRGFQTILAPGSELVFLQERTIRAGFTTPYDPSHTFDGVTAGPNPRRTYYLTCRMSIKRSEETRVIKAGKGFPIKGVTYHIENNIFHDFQNVVGINIIFDNPELTSMRCSVRDNFTGFDLQKITPGIFMKSMKEFFSSQSFANLKPREI